jgi:tRNA U34 5-carboxymethylaminomethyl modifying GTPase MnmE/TrmE
LRATPAAVAVVLTKCDLFDVEPLARFEREFLAAWATALRTEFPEAAYASFRTSARTGAGLAELAAWAGAQAREFSAAWRAARAAAGAAEREATTEAAAALDRAYAAAEGDMGEDAIAGELRLACRALDEAAGVWLPPGAWSERLLARLFADFCIGK